MVNLDKRLKLQYELLISGAEFFLNNETSMNSNLSQKVNSKNLLQQICRSDRLDRTYADAAIFNTKNGMTQ